LQEGKPREGKIRKSADKQMMSKNPPPAIARKGGRAPSRKKGAIDVKEGEKENILTRMPRKTQSTKHLHRKKVGEHTHRLDGENLYQSGRGNSGTKKGR